jgi:hypothetical protein
MNHLDLYADTLKPAPNRPFTPAPQAAASHRWRAITEAFVDTGGLVSGDELADRLRQPLSHDALPQVSQPISLVARWIVSGAVISLDSPWGILLPLFQFDLPRAAPLPAVLMVRAELQGALDSVDEALWFVTPNEWLNGERPAAALRAELPAVRRAARQVVAAGG